MKNKTLSIAVIITLIISIIAIMNPHFEEEYKDETFMVRVHNHAQFANYISYKELKNADVYSIDFECSKDIELTNNFEELCEMVNKTYYCPTVPIWEARGDGVCFLKYKNKVRILKWF